MEHIDGAAEDGDAVDGSTEALHLRRKDTDQPPQQPESRNASENPAPALDTGWPEHQPSASSPETFLQVLVDSGLNTELNSQSQQPARTPVSTIDPGVMVKELTVKNYKSPVSGSSSSGGEPSAARRGLWHNFTRMAGAQKESQIGFREGAGTLLPPQLGAPRPPPPFAQFGLNYPNVSDKLHGGDKQALLQGAPPAGIRTKVLQASGFPQFMVKTNLKGKGIAYRHQENHDPPSIVMQTQHDERLNEKADIAHNSSNGPSMRRDGKALLGGGGVGISDGKDLFDDGSIGISDVRDDGISLREWLKQRHRKFNKADRLHILRQIVELVNITHSQGLTLQHLRPSYFLISPANQVKYNGSLVLEGQREQLTGLTNQTVGYMEHHLKRKRYLEDERERHLMPKHQILGGHNQIGVRHNISFSRGNVKGDTIEQIDASSFSTQKSESDYRMQLKLGEQYYTGNMSRSPIVSNFGFQLSKSEFMKLEERWYASPEELNGSACSLSSNIYNLGVLLFELFCSFETWEVHSAAMSNLHHRILPPNFLSRSPKEASFCLLLLHPEPSSRPKSRDILTCELICEGRNSSFLDQSSASIEEEEAEADLLLNFLLTLKEHTEKQAAKLVADLGCLQADIEEVERRHSSRAEFLSSARKLQTNSNGISDMFPHRGSRHVEVASRMSMSSTNEDRLMWNIDQLKSAYLSMRSKVELSETNAAARADKDVLKIRDRYFQVQSDADIQDSADRLGIFFDGLCKYARYSTFEVRGSLRNMDILNSANVICSLSFDRDEEYFAAAGVSKKIKIFEFSSLLNNSVDIHYPLIEMSSRSKLSCVSWNSYIKNYLASTDYEGVVQLWDASTGQGFAQYTEHQKRAWSVDFSQTDPIKLASGSDDCSVKLWSINEKNCIDTVRNMANVCCVQFSSHSSHLLAFGSADYKIYCYDLRNTKIPWCILSGHRKTVSYVKFIGSETLVSASTDNTLKLWDLNKTNEGGLSTSACSLTFTGHTNEKNFVGLSVSDGYIACGSETNEVYAYYKTLPMPMASHKFGSIDPITEKETGDDNGQFVSSVCWRPKSNMVVAANSSGSIKLLQLV